MGDVRITEIGMTEVGTTLVLHPAWGLQAGRTARIYAHRGETGRDYAYRSAFYDVHRLPLAHISTEERDVLHAWWRTGARLLLTLDDALEQSHVFCRTGDRGFPLSRHVTGAADRWGGVLTLRALDSRRRLGLPFLLDHPSQGRLDQPALSLL